jgi:hypothetical protein
MASGYSILIWLGIGSIAVDAFPRCKSKKGQSYGLTPWMSTVARKPAAVNQFKSRNLTDLDSESKKRKDFNREINEPGFRFSE